MNEEQNTTTTIVQGEQLKLILELGYSGDISFEPFGKEVQTMEIGALKAAVNQSIDYMIKRLN